MVSECRTSLHMALGVYGVTVHIGIMKWSLTVTGNWRLIFRYSEGTNTASEIDLIDYH